MIMPTPSSPSPGCFAVGCLCQCCQERFLALEGSSWLPSAMGCAQPMPMSLTGHVVNPRCCQALLRLCLILPATSTDLSEVPQPRLPLVWALLFDSFCLGCTRGVV